MSNVIRAWFWLACVAASPHCLAQLYDVRPGEVNYNKNPRAALKVEVDGQATEVREYFQDWMKSSYNVRFKGGGLLGFGKSDVLTARQTPASVISGKLVDLFAAFVAPSDSVTEVAVFGGYDDKSFFAPNTSEYTALRSMVQNYAGAARANAYRTQVARAEKALKDVEKEKARLEKSRQSLQANTASNLQRIEELKKQNLQNLQQARADSAALVKNSFLLETAKLRLQRRRDRLSTLDRKN